MNASRPTSGPLAAPPPQAWEPLWRLTRFAARPLEQFLGIEAASGLLLLAMAAIALGLANSSLAAEFSSLWHTPMGLRVGPWQFERTLEWVVNDGLMVVFFFVIGLEIRREVHHGELATFKRALLPLSAAVGGMVAPALLYIAIAGAPTTRSGWGVPMATDIAFAVGILTLLGPRIPAALRVLLLALAVIDDLGSIVVIALFYSGGIEVKGLGMAAVGLLCIAIMKRAGVRAKGLYVLPGLVVWAGTAAAGIHPTIAGVVVGLMTPVEAWLRVDDVTSGLDHELESLKAHDASHLVLALQHVDALRKEALSPAESLITMLHPWVAYVIMPIFALANAGVSLASSTEIAPSVTQVTLAVVVGLVVGKPLGILLASTLVLRLRLATAPAGLGPRHFVVLGLVAGVGFTMALFIAQLAFGEPALLDAAKRGVLAASGVASAAALGVGWLLLPKQVDSAAATTADAAENSTAQ